MQVEGITWHALTLEASRGDDYLMQQRLELGDLGRRNSSANACTDRLDRPIGHIRFLGLFVGVG
jgi:hypothetical protein